MQDSKRDTDVKNRLLGEGLGGMIWENNIETCILPYVKRWTVQVRCMNQGTQASALGHPRRMGWGGQWERGSGWGDIGIPVADSCWCMTKNTTIF